MKATEAAAFVGIIGLLNGFGRIAWSTVSDYLGRGWTYVVFFVLEIAAFWKLSSVCEVMAFQGLVLLIVSCYGGGFSCMPAYLSDIFGTKQLSAIHGRILTAWGLAGVVGPFLVSFFRETTSGYSLILQFFAACFVGNLLVALWLKMKSRAYREQLDRV